jgi:hypothetical protein
VTNDRRSCFLHGVQVATELHVYFEQVLKSNKSDRPQHKSEKPLLPRLRLSPEGILGSIRSSYYLHVLLPFKMKISLLTLITFCGSVGATLCK